MGLRDLLRQRRMRDDDSMRPMRRYQVTFDDDGVNFVTTAEDFALLNSGHGQRSSQEQHLVLEMLEEQGAAHRLANGFVIPKADAVRLGADECEVLTLPPRFPGTLRAELTGHTTTQRFAVAIRPEVDGRLEPLARDGAVIAVGTSKYLLSPRMLRAIEAVEQHAALPREQRTEATNVRLVAQLQAARLPVAGDPDHDTPFPLSLGHLDSFSTAVPSRVGLLVDEQEDGSLRVSPDLGEDVDPGALERRWHHLDPDESEGVIRVDRQLVLLDEPRRKGVAEVLANPVIPAEQKDDFLRAPGDFFSPEYVDTTISFGVRVAGVGVIVPQTFADATDSGISWFGDSPGIQPIEVLNGLLHTLPELDKAEQNIEAAREQGRSVVSFGDNILDISDGAAVDAVLSDTRERLHGESAGLPSTAPEGDLSENPGSRVPTVQVGLHVREMRDLSAALQATAARASLPYPVDYSSLRLQPFPHQREGIEWLVALMNSSLDRPDDDAGRIQGAILADDMGLGKTFMTLVAVREFLKLERLSADEVRPTLAVLPLSLVENWEHEIAKAFPTSPFSDVVVLQSGQDLPRFKLRGAGRETKPRSTDGP